jgi:DNA-binding MarR family transcriptional regulator
MSIRTRVQQRAFPTPAEEAIVGIVLVAERVSREFGAACREHGITDDQYNVLRILRGAGPAGMARCDIAQRTIARAPDTTRMIDRLVKQGLVVRQWGEANRRLSIARITPKGLAVLRALQPALDAVQGRLAAGIPEPQLKAMIRVLDRMLEGEDGPPPAR